MSTLYPLRFQPLYKQYIWGGRKLETSLGRTLGPGANYAESWEICDHGADQSIVDHGPLKGKTLADLVARDGRELLGRHHPLSRFPLLVKFLDARETLSIQVHPNDEQAARLNPPDFGKTEAWFVIEAEPGSLIYAGLKPGVDRAMLETAIRQGRCQDCLHWFHPKAGDYVFLPAGTVHSLGGGVLAVEVQQSSDTTFRLFDWNRLAPDGKPRQLHIEEGLEAIDYNRGPVNPTAAPNAEHAGVSRLVECDQFVLERQSFAEPCEIGGDQRFHIIIVLEGSLRIDGDRASTPVSRGNTVLLPAGFGQAHLTPQNKAIALEVYLPD